MVLSLGIGNSAKLFSSNLKSEVFAIDASESIDFAYKKYGSKKYSFYSSRYSTITL